MELVFNQGPDSVSDKANVFSGHLQHSHCLGVYLSSTGPQGALPGGFSILIKSWPSVFTRECKPYCPALETLLDYKTISALLPPTLSG